ncbi:alpha/beta hydrolase [Ponticoccus alexandrii]|uniref:Alpha/beta fold hydrolase n=1 Tax=Ponticoccus alexandrii TaxID=1943633 RepID=A0ABX7F6M7_9RHOB|nr:alpha/beta hydrolase [Ponticoccus alexandrii]ETA53811.1 alpha/beta hydrolase [Rhodobacteraceae bacterium PD-2]QRF66124.1 alpha/beta fold hydrolase [Ponticoccus alexandrii]
MSPEQIFALIAALTAEPDPNAFATLKAGGADPVYPVTIAPCARPVAPSEIDGKTVICGTVAVPFDHRAPDGAKINIAFNLYKAHSLTPAPDPVIYLHGGPGTGTVGKVAKTVGYFEHLRGRRDIIAIDERGVDASAPEMDCYATLGDQLGDVVETRFKGLEMAPLEHDFIEGCLAELAAKGIDTSLINTGQNAMDVPAVMSALGYDSYNIYGISYGTKLTMEILRQNPPGIRAAVIDGNAPPWLPLYSMFWQSHSAPIQLSLSPCERDPVCSEAYPDIVARTFALYETLAEAPVEGPNGQIDPGTLWGVIDQRVDVTGAYKAITPYIPLMVTQLEQGDTTIIDQILSGALPPTPSTSSAEAARAAALAAGLSNAEMAQVEVMLSAAAHIEIAEDTVDRAARQLEGNLDAGARDTNLAELFDDRLAAAIRAMPDQAARLAVGRDYLDLRFEEPSAARLVTLIETHMTGETAEALSGLARQLDDAEVTRVFDLIREDNEATVQDVEGALQLYLYACQEDFADGWNSSKKFSQLMAEDGAWGPLMQEAIVDMVASFETACPLFEKHPRENWTTVGSSDRPVLSMNGELDTQTAGVWGELAVQDYSEAQLVMVPESGHGTIRFSQCAKDITAAFIEDPEGGLDTSCVEDLRLPVMLPDGTMHPLPY